MTFSAWKIKFLNPMTFQVFHDLYELYTCVIESDFTWDSSTLQQRWVIIMYVLKYLLSRQAANVGIKNITDFNAAVLVNLALLLLCSWIPSWTISMFALNLFLLALNFASLLYAITFFSLYIFSPAGPLSLALFSKTHDCFQQKLNYFCYRLGKRANKVNYLHSILSSAWFWDIKLLISLSQYKMCYVIA